MLNDKQAMSRNIFGWILAVAFMLPMSSCKDSNKNRNTNTDEDETEQTSPYSFPEADNPPAVDELLERPDFTFSTKVITDKDGVAEKIIVSMKNSVLGSTFEDKVSAEPLDPTQWHGFGEISEHDINFDGYPDLQVCRGPVNSYGNFTYAAWLWNQELHDFISVDGFEELFDPVYNKEDKVVTSSFRMDDHEDNAVYKWNGDRLEEVSSETIVYKDLYDE